MKTMRQKLSFGCALLFVCAALLLPFSVRAEEKKWGTINATVNFREGGVAMNSGTQAAKEAGNMVDLDNDPTKLIEIVEIGKQLLMTRGTLTTFSIANDVAKYFAIVPALFMVTIPALAPMNIMHLHSPESAILSAIIFNAIIIPILIPLALRGVAYKPIGASALLRRNLLIYGLGGVIVPFIGIKLIDMIVGLFM